MKNAKELVALLVFATFLFNGCEKKEDPAPDPPGTETGILKLNLGLTVEESGRVSEISTDDFIVWIITSDYVDTVAKFDPWSAAPAEIELETGEYVVQAQNIYPPPAAAFETPWYYGESETFTIDKEEIKTITVNCALSNYKVAFNYSSSVMADFTTWSAKATRAISGEYLDWPMTETGEGYFLPGEDRSVWVHLEYEKEFDGGVISRDFYTTIVSPSAATLYNINVDAALADGEIVLVINVDDGFETVEIDLTASLTFYGPGTYEEVPGGATVTNAEGNPEQGFGKAITTWELSDVLLANTKRVLWGPTPNGIKGSMNDDIFSDVSPNEILDFDPVQSDLANGYMVFTGSTIISLAITPGSANVDLMFEIWVTNDADAAIPLISPIDLGLPPSIGGLAEFNSSTDVINVDFVLKAKNAGADPSTYVTFLDYYDAAATIPEKPAYSSYSGGFYWSNLDK
ncbi:MAG: DUF4493 domain-containing protein [Bacteroidota bacterium]